MGEYIGCGTHGVTRVVGYENDNATLVMGCGDRIQVEGLLVPIFEAPDEGPNAPVQAPTAVQAQVLTPEPIPVADAIEAADNVPEGADWGHVVAEALKPDE
jgi:hypothetical protein